MNHYPSQVTLNLALHKKRLIPKIARTFMDEYDKKADQDNLIESVADPIDLSGKTMSINQFIDVLLHIFKDNNYPKLASDLNYMLSYVVTPTLSNTYSKEIERIISSETNKKSAKADTEKIKLDVYYLVKDTLAQSICDYIENATMWQLKIIPPSINNTRPELMILNCIEQSIKKFLYANKDYVNQQFNLDRILEKPNLVNLINSSMQKSINKACQEEDTFSTLDKLRKNFIDNNIHSFEKVEQYLRKNIKSIMKENITSFFSYTVIKAIKQELNLPRFYAIDNSIIDWLIDNIDLNLAINSLFTELKKIRPSMLFNQFLDDPWNFIKFKDNTTDKNIVYSTRIPYLFSESRSGPLIVIDQEVLEGNNSNLSHHNDLLNKYKREHGITDDDSEAAYDQGYEKYKNVGVGSYFDKVALLEYVTTDNVETADIEEGTNSGGSSGNYEMVKGALLAHGYQKVYVNNFAGWTSKEYKRIAKKYHH